ncbi:hypothetical protein ABPG72_010893 [Tetrahymena utriculariae]
MVSIDIIIIGNSGAGKTCIAQKYVSDGNNDNNSDEQTNGDPNPNTNNADDPMKMKPNPTIGVDHFKKRINVNDLSIKINLWDTAGQEKYVSITKSFFQKADGVILTFDLTDYQSFKKIEEYWLQQVDENSSKSIKKILIGNKVDRNEERQVSALQGANLASKYNINYFETSALTGESVNLSIDTLVKQCAFAIEEHKGNQTDDIFEIIPNKSKQLNCFDKMKEISEKFFKMITPSKKNKQKSKKDSTKQSKPDDAVVQQQLQELQTNIVVQKQMQEINQDKEQSKNILPETNETQK